MAVSSGQITQEVLKQPNPQEAKALMWKKTRYLVAQKAASDDFTETTDGYYKGRVVMPGPRADPRFGVMSNVDNLDIIESMYYIRFIDSNTTDGADASVGAAIFTIMSPLEADEYEAVLNRMYPRQVEA